MNILNIEIKAHCANPDAIRKILLENNATFKGEDHQIDTYFTVPSGRLKLREGNIENTLIFYDRIEAKGIKKSIVELFHPSNDVDSLKKVLLKSLPTKVVVDKKREIYFIDNVKFHIDNVKGLGSFMEIEAISQGDQFTEEYLNKQCQQYINLLKVGKDDFIDQSYSDLLITKNAES